jgi:hypothetical protein
MGFLLPSALQDLAVHLPWALPRPTTFRLQGLVTLLAVYSRRARAGFFFAPAALMGFALRSFPLSKGIRGFRRQMDPHTVRPIGAPDARRHWAGPTDPGFRALTLPRVPGGQVGVSSPTAGCSLGLRPSRAYQRKPCLGSLPSSSHVLSDNQPEDRRRRHHRVSINSRLAPSTALGKPGTWTRQPF